MSSGARTAFVTALVLSLSACRERSVPETTADPAPARVTTARAEVVDMGVWLTTAGAVKSQARSDVAANVAGRVVEIFFDRGRAVRAHEPLLRVDVTSAALSSAEAEAAQKSAVTQREIAAAECARADALKARGALTDQEHEAATARCRAAVDAETVARARLASTKKAVSDGLVRAPFAGRIAERFVHVGEYVHEDTKLATLLTDAATRLEFTLGERYLASVSEGTPVRFRVAAYPGASIEAKVQSVGSAVREASRDVVVDAVVDPATLRSGGPAGEVVLLRAGMFAKVEVRVGARPLPSIPRRALRAVRGSNHVFVVRDDMLEERTVAVIDRDADTVAVTNGLAVGELVVVDPSEALRNGQGVAQ
jgi:membrane fusion protein (multidrug efflux system)